MLEAAKKRSNPCTEFDIRNVNVPNIKAYTSQLGIKDSNFLPLEESDISFQLWRQLVSQEQRVEEVVSVS